MKRIFYMPLILLLNGALVFGQTGDTITKKAIFQIGYVTEYIDGGIGAKLNGVEGQLKLLFGKHKLAKGERLDLAAYFNIGYTYFPGSEYTLGQGNIGFGINTPAPIFGKFLRMDIGLGAVFYHGTVSGKNWVGKTIDYGGHLGLSVPFGRNGAVYGKLWVPGGISMLTDDSYIPPMFITMGIEF